MYRRGDIDGGRYRDSCFSISGKTKISEGEENRANFLSEMIFSDWLFLRSCNSV